MMLGDGPNTFLPFWTAKQLRDWFKEQDQRALAWPHIYRGSLWWRDWIAMEMRRRRMKDAPLLLTAGQRRYRIAKAKRNLSGREWYPTITFLANGITRSMRLF